MDNLNELDDKLIELKKTRDELIESLEKAEATWDREHPKGPDHTSDKKPGGHGDINRPKPTEPKWKKGERSPTPQPTPPRPNPSDLPVKKPTDFAKDEGLAQKGRELREKRKQAAKDLKSAKAEASKNPKKGGDNLATKAINLDYLKSQQSSNAKAFQSKTNGNVHPAPPIYNDKDGNKESANKSELIKFDNNQQWSLEKSYKGNGKFRNFPARDKIAAQDNTGKVKTFDKDSPEVKAANEALKAKNAKDKSMKKRDEDEHYVKMDPKKYRAKEARIDKELKDMTDRGDKWDRKKEHISDIEANKKNALPVKEFKPGDAGFKSRAKASLKKK